MTKCLDEVSPSISHVSKPIFSLQQVLLPRLSFGEFLKLMQLLCFLGNYGMSQKKVTERFRYRFCSVYLNIFDGPPCITSGEREAKATVEKPS